MRDEQIFKVRRRNALKWIFCIALVLWGVSYIQNEISDSAKESDSSSIENSIKSSPLAEYSIINKEFSLPYKASFDVRIFKKLQESQLKRISRVIQRQSQNATKVFVVFYLPGMEVDAGGWATAHKGEDVRIMEFMLDTNPTTLEN